jgi:predicted phosphoadenosine phosphosulfate sulfurtransferase
MTLMKAGARDVVAAARQRIINSFSNGLQVYVSFSGGKDSLVLLDLVLSLAAEGRIDAGRLIVEFIDEEAIFACIERTVREWRTKVLLTGGRFTWFCLEVRHFNCFNQLENDESFICWDKTKRAVWIREPPAFAVREHPLCRNRLDSYQQFLTKHNGDGLSVTGVRAAESLQRRKYMANSFATVTLSKGNTVWPLYDWQDADVWRYLWEHEIAIPDIYLYLYQTGHSRRELRVSQFFSIDTARSLVKMTEYYPDLMDRIIQREPNAYLAALYWDSEMFRRATRARRAQEADTPRDYKQAVFRLIREYKERFATQGLLRNAKAICQLLLKYGIYFDDNSTWQKVYDCLVTGDPKQRTLRGLMVSISARYLKEYEDGLKKAVSKPALG